MHFYHDVELTDAEFAQYRRRQFGAIRHGQKHVAPAAELRAASGCNAGEVGQRVGRVYDLI